MGTAKIHREVARLPGIDIFYRDSEAEGPAMLCLHGRWGRGETWVDFMRRYGDRYRVIAPDLRGHGMSGKPVSSYSGEEMADDMIALMDRLGVESAVIVGHSMGGHVAGCLAAAHPSRVRALAILDKSAGGPASPDPRAPGDIPAVDPVAGDWPMPFASRVEAEAFLRAAFESRLGFEYFMNSLVEDVDGYRMMFSARAISANIASYHSWYDSLRRISCPVFLLRSSSHEAVPDDEWEKMRSLLPGCMARESSLPDHNVQLSDKEEFYRYFDEFLAAAGL
jgi:2-succinyl-6-hydroxy-2,4-cyclohexadiene-1-carboxylate synthase